MKIPLIREKAHSLGLKELPRNKKELVRAIQVAEGNNPCFGTDVKDCPHTNCCFRSDCLAGE